MQENPVRIKLYYLDEKSVPKPCQSLIDVNKKMENEEDARHIKMQKCWEEFFFVDKN